MRTLHPLVRRSIVLLVVLLALLAINHGVILGVWQGESVYLVMIVGVFNLLVGSGLALFSFEIGKRAGRTLFMTIFAAFVLIALGLVLLIWPHTVM